MTLKLDLRNAILVLELAPNFKLSLIFNNLQVVCWKLVLACQLDLVPSVTKMIAAATSGRILNKDENQPLVYSSGSSFEVH